MSRFLLFLNVCLSFSLSAGIVELQSLNSLESFIHTQDPLIIFDVKNTFIKKRSNFNDLKQCFGQIDNAAFQLRWFFVDSVEPDALPIIKKLQEKYTIIVLTKNKSLLNYYKFFQLHTLGLDFSQTFPHIPFYYIKQDQSPALFDKGMISTGANEKGEVLKLFLVQQNIKPTQIIFVDDALKNLKSVEKIAQELNIPFTGIHYTRAHKEKT